MTNPLLPLTSAADVAEATYGLEEFLSVASTRLGEEITPRTVRLYATEGLIDRPGKEGRRAVYGHRHLLQLLLVRSLVRRGLSLSAIAPLVVVTDEELEQQLSQMEESPSPSASTAERNEALAYLQSLQAGAALESEEVSPSLLPMLGTPISPRSRSRPSSRGSASASHWCRFSLAPGVELHLSETASIPPPGHRREAWLQHLLARLREQLEDPS